MLKPLPLRHSPARSQSFIKRGNQTLIKLGDKEVDYNFDFRCGPDRLEGGAGNECT